MEILGYLLCIAAIWIVGAALLNNRELTKARQVNLNLMAELDAQRERYWALEQSLQEACDTIIDLKQQLKTERNHGP